MNLLLTQMHLGAKIGLLGSPIGATGARPAPAGFAGGGRGGAAEIACLEAI